MNTGIREIKFFTDNEMHSLLNDDTRLIKITKKQLKNIIDNAIIGIKKANKRLKNGLKI